MMSRKQTLLLRVLILLGLIVFGFVLAWRYGLMHLAISADRSYLSSVILLLYAALTAHWLFIAWRLSGESDAADMLEERKEGTQDGSLVTALAVRIEGDLAPGQRDAVLELFGDQLANRHAFGYFASDVLLRLGLLGTIIGFILMLLPVADIREFDSSVMQQLLGSMSGGMAVALYTTLAGLITSTLLRLQYHVLEAAAVDVVTRVSLFVHTSATSENVTDAA